MTPQMWASLASWAWGASLAGERSEDETERDRDDVPDTPTDEPSPEPIEDPPAEPGPQGPYVVGRESGPTAAEPGFH